MRTLGHTHRIGSRAVVGLVAALTAGLLAGCGDAVPPTVVAARGVPPQTVAPAAGPQPWLASVCTALGPAVRPAAPAPEIVVADPDGSRERMLAYLDERVTSFRSALDGVNAAGPAPVPDGQAVTAPVADLLDRRVDTLAQERRALAAVPTSSPETLLTTLSQVRAQLSLSGPATSLGDIALGPGLTAAAASVPQCRVLAR